MRWRIAVSMAIGVGSGVYCWLLLMHFHLGAGDFNWAVWAAQDLLAHRNPYDRVMQMYPLPAAFYGLPFVRLPLEVAAGVFYGLSSALMAFGLSRQGYHRLLVFLAYPYWAGLMAAQWSPIIFASAFFPFLLTVTLAKSTFGLPIALTNPTKRGFIACFVVLS